MQPLWRFGFGVKGKGARPCRAWGKAEIHNDFPKCFHSADTRYGQISIRFALPCFWRMRGLQHSYITSPFVRNSHISFHTDFLVLWVCLEGTDANCNLPYRLHKSATPSPRATFTPNSPMVCLHFHKRHSTNHLAVFTKTSV